MKRIIVITFLTACMVAGCSTTHVVKQEKGLRVYKKAALVTTNNEKIDVMYAYTKKDSIIAGEKDTYRELHFHISGIQKVITKNQGKGIKQGILFGATGGAIWGYLNGEDNPSDALASREEGAFILGIFGAVGGTLAGAIIKSTEIYVFQKGNEVKIDANK